MLVLRYIAEGKIKVSDESSKKLKKLFKKRKKALKSYGIDFKPLLLAEFCGTLDYDTGIEEGAVVFRLDCGKKELKEAFDEVENMLSHLSKKEAANKPDHDEEEESEYEEDYENEDEEDEEI